MLILFNKTKQKKMEKILSIPEILYILLGFMPIHERRTFACINSAIRQTFFQIPRRHSTLRTGFSSDQLAQIIADLCHCIEVLVKRREKPSCLPYEIDFVGGCALSESDIVHARRVQLAELVGLPFKVRYDQAIQLVRQVDVTHTSRILIWIKEIKIRLRHYRANRYGFFTRWDILMLPPSTTQYDTPVTVFGLEQALVQRYIARRFQKYAMIQSLAYRVVAELTFYKLTCETLEDMIVKQGEFHLKLQSLDLSESKKRKLLVEELNEYCARKREKIVDKDQSKRV